MKKGVLCVVMLLILPSCELIFGGACGGDSMPYFDVVGVQLTVNQHAQLISYRSVGLTFTLNERYYAARPVGLSAAYACSPTEFGYKGTQEQLDSLVFTSRYDYDYRHPAGTPLNDLLRTGAASADSVVAIQAGSMPPRFLSLSLRTPPARTGPQQFVVRYRQTNGEIYGAETQIVEVQP